MIYYPVSIKVFFATKTTLCVRNKSKSSHQSHKKHIADNPQKKQLFNTSLSYVTNCTPSVYRGAVKILRIKDET